MEEEPDLLAPPADSQSPTGSEADRVAGAGIESGGEPDLVPEADLRGLLAHLNPLAIRDITTIEKGVEHFFLFHQAHLALTRPDQLKFLTQSDLESMDKRDAVRTFGYVRYTQGSNSLHYVPILIRPASLKGEQVTKVRLGCIRGSVAAVLEYLSQRDARLAELEIRGELSRWVSEAFSKTAQDGHSLDPDSQQDLNRLIENLRSLSFEQLLDKEAEPPPEMSVSLLRLLSMRPDDLLMELALLPETSDSARAAVSNRGGLPVLLRLTPDFHVVQPPALQLVQQTGGDSQNLTSELEWILMLFVQLARRILLKLLPEEESGWIQKTGTAQAARYLEEMRKHPSLLSSDWPAVPTFLDAYEALIKHVHNLEQLRREFVIGGVVEGVRKQLNMQFEPVLFTPDTLSIPANVADRFDADQLFATVCARIRQAGDVMVMEERRELEAGSEAKRGVYMMHAANLPQGFIRLRKRRNFLHLYARQNGRSEGIYSFLREVTDSGSPREIVDEQIALSRAIREWENEQEKARLKKELASMGLFQRLWRSLLGLFGLGRARRSEDSEKPEKSTRRVSGKSGATGVLVGPREKRTKIPERVQKAVDYVDRKNRGIIWLHEVETALASTRYTSDGLGDLIFYDSEARYEEIRALVQEKRVFIARSRLNDLTWLEATLDYLENVASPGTHHGLLLEYLRGRVEELRAREG